MFKIYSLGVTAAEVQGDQITAHVSFGEHDGSDRRHEAITIKLEPADMPTDARDWARQIIRAIAEEI